MKYDPYLDDYDLGYDENQDTYNHHLVAQYAGNLGYEYVQGQGWIKEDEWIEGDNQTDS
jgi:hypothetical protein